MSNESESDLSTIAEKEKAKLTAGLVLANEKKANRAAGLVIANAEKAKRAAEWVIANSEKAKRAALLVIANLEKAKRADELIIANQELAYQNEEKAKRAAELVIADVNKTKREAELVIAKIEKAKQLAKSIIADKALSFQSEEKSKRAAELLIADAEKSKLEAELVIVNINKAKRSAGIIFANVEKGKRSAELVIANKELVYLKSQKAKRAAELIIANVEKAKRAAKLVIANIEKAKRCAELVITNKELALATERAKLTEQLIILNKELIREIEKRKQTESELIKAKEKAEESDRLKSAFLTNLSHEIRTPMNGILGFTDLLNDPDITDEEQKLYRKMIEKGAARLLNTINSIVDISIIESGLIEIDIIETALNEKVKFTYEFLKPEVENKGLKFSYKNGLPTNEAIIKTDHEKVARILTNLVRNAIKFTYDGSIKLGYEKKGDYLEFFVQDTGIGIPQKQQQLIFERFRQGNESINRGYAGSGLGLSISKSYVEMLGGRIWVKSEEDLGSTFYFTIPYIPVSVEKTKTEKVVSAEPRDVQLKNLKILIVEDDEISYSLISRTLQQISKEILHAITGVQAVEACRNNPDLDLVLMDIRMPLMDGLEATQQIRQFNNKLIIIAQTAYAFASDREKAIAAGCNDYISKPINELMLYELIKKHVK